MGMPRLHERVRGEVLRLVHRGLTVSDFSREVGAVLCRAVPAEGTCLMTTDPATLLPTAEYVANGLPAPALLRLVEIEMYEPDYNKWTDLARAQRPAASLSDVTEGDLDRSQRQREIRRPGGFADELRVVLSDRTGTWGQLTMFREANRPHFAEAEVHFLATMASLVADGLRRSLLLDEGAVGTGDVGVLVIDIEDGVAMSNPAAQSWLDALGAGDRVGARLPVAIPAVARQARALCAPPGAAPTSDARPAYARVRTRNGRWLVLRGSVLGEDANAPVAVTLEPARPAELAPLMADAYGLTAGERRVTELVVQGLSTRQIADRLHLSAYTVQDHLKSVFTKSGSNSRGDLTARLFFDHHASTLTSGGR
ncbi:MAG: helix-turn-helix transcriptional regulator [Jatrophihabitans sp.]